MAGVMARRGSHHGRHDQLTSVVRAEGCSLNRPSLPTLPLPRRGPDRDRAARPDLTNVRSGRRV
jgi:hypothetical protein